MNKTNNSKTGIVALIPVKGTSTRVPHKNFRPFYNDKSLLEIKLDQCIKSNIFDEIYVSSDSPHAKLIAQRYGATFLLRDQQLCRDDTPWGDVLEGILNSIPDKNETFVAWCPVTSPLFSRFKEIVEELEKKADHDSVVTVTPLNHYFLNADFIPINHQWGPWHAYSQGMRPIYQMNLACILAQKALMIRNRYQIGNYPLFFTTSAIEGIDIDTMEEFEMAALMYGWNYEKTMKL